MTRANQYLAAGSVVEEWLLKNVSSLEPLRGSTASEALFRRKSFNELVIYLLVRERAEGVPSSPSASLLHQHVLSRDWARLLRLASLNASTAIMFAIPIAYALKHGVFAHNAASRAREILTSDYVWGFERPVHRLLEIALACDVAELQPRASINSLIGASSLSLPPCALTSSRDGYYGLSHSAVYAGLMLQRPNLKEDAVDALIGGLCWTCVSGDVDLGLELSLALALFGHLSWGALQLVDSTVDQLLLSGSLDCSFTKTTVAFTDANPAEREFGRKYHTMLVAGLTLPTMMAVVTEDAVASVVNENEAALVFGEICSQARSGSSVNVKQLTHKLEAIAPSAQWRRQYLKSTQFLQRTDEDFNLII